MRVCMYVYDAMHATCRAIRCGYTYMTCHDTITSSLDGEL